jgi:pimeloyl-ACP methyl ester carboxylesterase
MKPSLLVALIIGMCLILWSCSTSTAQIKDATGNVARNGIASLEEVTIGETHQWILVRGTEKANPILLFLHGGPGSPYMGLSHKFQRELENNFVVVQWDQRGSGKSFPNTQETSMTVEQFKSDTHELVLYLKNRFQRDKIFLVGHSWGSYLGLSEAKKHPENLYAYIGAGQMIDLLRQEQLSHQFAMERARSENNKKAIKELTDIGSPPYIQIVDGMNTKYSWLWEYGGMIEGESSPMPFVKALMLSDEYSLLDISRFVRGMSFSLESFTRNEGDNFWQLKAPRNNSAFGVPIFFIAGDQDHVTPLSLVENYEQGLLAPDKNLFLIKGAGHFAFFTNPSEFSAIMAEIKNKTCQRICKPTENECSKGQC